MQMKGSRLEVEVPSESFKVKGSKKMVSKEVEVPSEEDRLK